MFQCPKCIQARRKSVICSTNVFSYLTALQIRDSLLGNNKQSLEAFTYHTANKYWRGQFTADLDFGYTVHNVILVFSLIYFL